MSIYSLVKRKILTVGPQFLVDDKRVGGDKFEEEFQRANRVTQYPGNNNKSQEKYICQYLKFNSADNSDGNEKNIININRFYTV